MHGPSSCFGENAKGKLRYIGWVNEDVGRLTISDFISLLNYTTKLLTTEVLYIIFASDSQKLKSNHGVEGAKGDRLKRFCRLFAGLLNLRRKEKADNDPFP